MATANTDKVQEAYIAYYGRPADPGGLAHWVGQLDKGVAFDVMLQAFGTSEEAVTLFGNKTPEETIQTLFQQILGRTPDPGGLAFYVGKLKDGSMTGITIAQNVFDGATGDDATMVANKLSVAKAFNEALDTAEKKAAYAGAAAVVTLRDMLATVDELTDPASFDVGASIEGLVSAANRTAAEEAEALAVAAFEAAAVHFDITAGTYNAAFVTAAASKKAAAAATWSEVSSSAVDGYQVNIDYEGKIDGIAFDGGLAKGYDLVLGSNTMITGFEDGIFGMDAGQTKDVTVTFPESYHNAELAGKEAVFTIKANTVSKVIVTDVALLTASQAAAVIAVTDAAAVSAAAIAASNAAAILTTLSAATSSVADDATAAIAVSQTAAVTASATTASASAVEVKTTADNALAIALAEPIKTAAFDAALAAYGSNVTSASNAASNAAIDSVHAAELAAGALDTVALATASQTAAATALTNTLDAALIAFSTLRSTELLTTTSAATSSIVDDATASAAVAAATAASVTAEAASIAARAVKANADSTLETLAVVAFDAAVAVHAAAIVVYDAAVATAAASKKASDTAALTVHDVALSTAFQTAAAIAVTDAVAVSTAAIAASNAVATLTTLSAATSSIVDDATAATAVSQTSAATATAATAATAAAEVKTTADAAVEDATAASGASNGVKIWGNAGNETLRGGAGKDQIVTRGGTDYAYGESGDDHINGYLKPDGGYTFWESSGAQWLYGGEGNDTIIGGSDVDNILGKVGNDYVDGREGNDVISGGDGNDKLVGSEGNDSLNGDSGVDELYGSEGDDTLNGGAGSDWMRGGDGDDTYYIDDIWDDVYDTSGNDTLHISVDYYNVDSTIENIQYSDGVKELPYWIDALLNDNSSAYHYHYLDNDKTFKYLFPPKVLSYFDAKDLNGWSPAGSSLKAAFIHTTSLLSSLVDVNFVETADADQANTIAVSTNAQTGSGGYAAYPDNSRIYDDFDKSDIFMDDSYADPSITSPNYDLDSLVHELGHALGLKHPFSHENASGNIAQTPYLTSSLENNNQWTAMSYTDDAKYYSASFRPLDLAALQYLYGVSPSLKAGNTIFTFSKNKGTFVYDGEGIDTIDATNATAAATIYLTQGDWSYIGVKSDLITASNQLTINFNTVIESVKGGSFNDTLYGNDIDNTMDGNSGSDDIYGYLGNDTISGGEGNDRLFGGEGNDYLYGEAGTDILDGGSGIDTSIYDSNFANYTILKIDDNYLLSDLTGVDGSDTLTNIERLSYTDTDVALDIDGANSAGGIYRTYQAAFNRTPDKGGFGYWIDRADNGASAVQMAEGFVWSAEFQTLYGVTTSDNYLVGNDIEAVVDLFYRNVLGRTPDQGGLDYYASTIVAQDKTGGRVLAEIADSAENRTNLLPTIENGMSYDLWVA